jgi:hypothetical protein
LTVLTRLAPLSMRSAWSIRSSRPPQKPTPHERI